MLSAKAENQPVESVVAPIFLGSLIVTVSEMNHDKAMQQDYERTGRVAVSFFWTGFTMGLVSPLVLFNGFVMLGAGHGSGAGIDAAAGCFALTGISFLTSFILGAVVMRKAIFRRRNDRLPVYTVFSLLGAVYGLAATLWILGPRLS